MYSIAYVIPYFGKFNNYFQLWLDSCKWNPTIDFLIFTDDETRYIYPENVHVTYMSFREMQERIQKLYDFEISLEHPYRLCDFKVAYGEIFAEELKEYDYWGHCDTDLIWGDIRKYMTDEILEEYDRIGYLGHSSLYKNIDSVNTFYKLDWDGDLFYKKAFGEDKTHFFDEWGSLRILSQHGFKCYSEIIMADVSNLYWHFYLCHFPNSMDYKNNKPYFVWEKGKLYRVYLDKKKKRHTEEYMYIHLISRLMDTGEVQRLGKTCIIPGKFIECNTDNPLEMSNEFLNSCNKKSIVKYLRWWKQKYGSWSGVLQYIKGTLRPRYRILFFNDEKII